jgi:hypothetical protein
VNLSPTASRAAILQAGTFGEHRFDDVRYTALDGASLYPGGASYAPPDPTSTQRHQVVAGKHLLVYLPPGTQITLSLTTTRFVHQPTYAFPWDAGD